MFLIPFFLSDPISEPERLGVGTSAEPVVGKWYPALHAAIVYPSMGTSLLFIVRFSLLLTLSTCSLHNLNFYIMTFFTPSQKYTTLPALFWE
jgi:hypothetical protein